MNFKKMCCFKNGKIYNLGADYVAENYAWEASGWFWSIYDNKQINDVIDTNEGDVVEKVTRKVNGGTRALEEIRAAYEKAIGYLC